MQQTSGKGAHSDGRGWIIIRAAAVVGRCECTVHRAWWKRVGGPRRSGQTMSLIGGSPGDSSSTTSAGPRRDQGTAANPGTCCADARCVDPAGAMCARGGLAGERVWVWSTTETRMSCTLGASRNIDLCGWARWIVSRRCLCLGENSGGMPGAETHSRRETNAETPPRRARAQKTRTSSSKCGASGQEAPDRKEIGSRQEWRMEKPRPEKVVERATRHSWAKEDRRRRTARYACGGVVSA